VKIIAGKRNGHDIHDTSLNDLKTSHWVNFSEGRDGSGSTALHTDVIKRITGGDKLDSRAICQDSEGPWRPLSMKKTPHSCDGSA
jgi:hypothetical protein